MVKLGEVSALNPRRDQSISDATIISFIEMKSLLESGSVCPVIQSAKKYLKGYSTFRNRDVLVAKITPCFQNNKIGLARIDTSYGFGTTEFHVLRAQEELLAPEYLVLFLRQQKVLAAGEARMTGSGGQRRVPKSFLENLKIPLPPLNEQKRIAEILGGVADCLIAVQSEIDKVESLVAGVISRFSDDGKMMRLDELAVISGGLSLGSHRKSKPLTSKYLRVANVFWGQVSYEEIKELKCTEKELERTILQDGDIVIVEAHANKFQVGRSATIRNCNEQLVFQNHLFRARPVAGIDSDVLAAMLSSFIVRRQLYQMAKTTSGLNTISISQVRSLQIPVPTDSGQVALNSNLRQLDHLCQLLRQKLALLEELQRSLSARAFDGRL